MNSVPKEATSKKVGIAGIIAIAAAGIGLFMPVILMMFLAPIAFIAASVELVKGKKWLGAIAMVLAVIELGVVLSTFQSCYKSLSSIGGEFTKPSTSTLERVKSMVLVDVDAKVVSRDDVIYRYSWRLTLKNLTDKPVTVDVNIQYLDTEGFEVFHDKEFDLPLSPYEKKTFTGTTIMGAEEGIKVKSVKAIVVRVTK